MITISGVNVATVSALTSISNSVVFTGTSSQVLDSQTLASTRSAEYLISANNNDANAYQVSKILVIHDGTETYITEYGTMITNTSVITISAGANATHMFVNCTPVSSNTTVKFTRFALGV
jgi:ABC-type cobalamin transport system ATPase subunit